MTGRVGTSYPIGVKLNATDNLEGGLRAHEALKVVSSLGELTVDLIDVSGGESGGESAPAGQVERRQHARGGTGAQHPHRFKIPLLYTNHVNEKSEFNQ